MINRDQPGHSQLGRLLDEPVEPLPLGDRRRQGQPAGGHAIGDRLAEQGEVDPVLAGARHPGARREPLAIEDLDDLPDPDPADPGQVAGLVAFEDQPALDRGIGTEAAVGHLAPFGEKSKATGSSYRS